VVAYYLYLGGSKMKKLCLSLLCGAIVLGVNARPALADKAFGKEFTARYVAEDPTTDAEKDWAKTVKKAKCYICHVKGKSKKYCNTYGDALAEFLDHDDFKKERIKAQPDQVKEEIQAALEKAEAAKEKCGSTFGELLKAHKLPSKDMGAKSLVKEKKAEEEKEDDEEEDEKDDDEKDDDAK